MTASKKKPTASKKTSRNVTTSAKKKKSKFSKQKEPPKIRLASPRKDGAYALDDWVPSQMGFGDLYRHLKPESSEVDRICKLLLDQNFPIRYLNVVFGRKGCDTVQKHRQEIKQKCPDFKNYRFVSGPNGDDPLIVHRWERLVAEANIQTPIECYKNFSMSKKVISFELLKCYLLRWISISSFDSQRIFAAVLK